MFIGSLYFRVRWWFFETFGERISFKYYEGHGNYSEECGWLFCGRFYKTD